MIFDTKYLSVITGTNKNNSMEEKTKGVINKDLSNGEIVIGTNPNKAATGNGNLQVILDVMDEDDNRCQFITAFGEKMPDVMNRISQSYWMHGEFTFNKNEGDVTSHKRYKEVSKFIEPFFTFQFGDKVQALKKEKLGVPVYIGRDSEDHINIAYVFTDKSNYIGGAAPQERIPVEKAMAGMGLDAGKPKTKVKYITIEDEVVTVNVISMDDIKDLKKLLYRIG